MKFNYPAKLYLGGLIYFFFFAILGFYTIQSMTRGEIILKMIYVITCILLFDWYYTNYKKFKDNYLIVDKTTIEIYHKKNKEIIEGTDIECIINANHQQLLKIHNVTHIFTKDNRYFCFTNEINNYTKFKYQLKSLFSDKYLEVEKTIKDSNTDKNYLVELSKS